MLAERDRAILQFENAWTRDAGKKHEKIRATFDLSAARYYLLVNRILDDPETLEAFPVEVARLRRLRESRLNKRANRVFE